MADPMPVFVIKAKDRLAVEAVACYRDLCQQYGLTDQAREVVKALVEIVDWQDRNPDALKWPDHPHVPTAERGDG